MRVQPFLVGLVIVGVGAAGCQKTTVEGPEGKKLTLMKPADQIIKPGVTSEVTVRINRENFNEPVKVRLAQMPEGVEVKEAEQTIPPDKDSATFTFTAEDKLSMVASHRVAVTAEGPDGMKATEHFEVSTEEGLEKPNQAPSKPADGKDKKPAPKSPSKDG